MKKVFLIVLFSLMVSGCTPGAPSLGAAPTDAVVPAPASEDSADAGGQVSPEKQPFLFMGTAGSFQLIPAATVLNASLHPRTGAASFVVLAGWPGMADVTSPTMGLITITGHVINASGGMPPQNSFMELTIYENGSVLHRINIPLSASGIYEFDLVPWSPAFSYQVSTTFNNLKYYSGLVDGNLLKSGTILDLPVIVYDSSTNAQFLRGVRMRVTYDFTSPGWVHVTEAILISNPTSLVIVPVDESSPVLDFPLPKDAVNVSFPDDNPPGHYQRTADGFGDWQPVMPGDGHQVMVEYSVPFTSSWRDELVTPIPLDSLMVIVRSSGIVTTGSGMTLSLAQSIPQSSVNVYTSSDLQPNEEYALNFATRDHIQKVWIGIAFFAASILFALLWLVFSRRRKTNQPALTVAENSESMDTILDAIIALDDRFKNGDISKTAYQRARSELVKKLEGMKDQTKG